MRDALRAWGRRGILRRRRRKRRWRSSIDCAHRLIERSRTLSWNIESDLKKALRSLKNQGISVNEEQIPPDGPVFFVNIPPNGFALTQSQILKLYEERQLDSL